MELDCISDVKGQTDKNIQQVDKYMRLRHFEGMQAGDKGCKVIII